MSIRPRFASASAGFTILELLATITIFIIMTTVVLLNYPKFGEQLGLDLRAQEIALLTRQAQVFALGVRGTTFTTAPAFQQGVFGVYFNMLEPDLVRFFADRNTIDFRYNPDTGDCGAEASECVEIFSITRAYYIVDICAYKNGNQDCEVNQLHVGYQRPNPEATIKINELDTLYSYADVVLRSPRSGIMKKVVVYASGQISVQDIEPEI